MVADSKVLVAQYLCGEIESTVCDFVNSYYACDIFLWIYSTHLYGKGSIESIWKGKEGDLRNLLSMPFIASLSR